MARSILLGLVVLAACSMACAVEDSTPPKPLRTAIAKNAPLPATGPSAGPASATTPAASPEATTTTTTTAAALPVDSAKPPAAPVEVSLADLTLDVVANGYGPLEKNMSNGDINANDGKTLTLEGVTYAKGLGVHADSEVNVALDGKYKTFLADVGVDDEVGANGSVEFKVIVDGQSVFESGVMTGGTATKNVNVDVTGKTELKLVVTNGGDGIDNDHADWAGARLVQ
jgi:hypothetical protein